jgi:hypothetical protein
MKDFDRPFSQGESFKDSLARIQLTEFHGKSEDYVREEFLVELFRLAGYSAIGPFRTERGINLSPLQRLPQRRDERRHIYPDFVLYANRLPLWIVDAKSPRIRVDRPDHILQIASYADALDCPNLMLSNARASHLFSFVGGKMRLTDVISSGEFLEGGLSRLVEWLKPENTVRRILSFAEALERYATDDYVDRSFLMKLLQTYPADDVIPVLEDFENPLIYKHSHFRNRALPAILGVPFAKTHPIVFRRVMEFSMSDSNVVVRENFLTCIMQDRGTFPGADCRKRLLDANPESFLEDLLLASCLTMSPAGCAPSKRQLSHDRDVRDYVRLFEKLPIISFPLALPMTKPRGLRESEYQVYLGMLPRILERIERDSHTHPETIKVIKGCMQYARNRNPGVYHYLGLHSDRRQRGLIEHFSR